MMPPPPQQRKAALAAYRPLPFPSPFGPAFALEEVPPPLRPSASDPEPASSSSNKRDSGWSEATLSWSEFALDEGAGKLVHSTAEEGVASSWSERARDWTDERWGPHKRESGVIKWRDQYEREGYGVHSDPFVVRWLNEHGQSLSFSSGGGSRSR